MSEVPQQRSQRSSESTRVNMLLSGTVLRWMDGETTRMKNALGVSIGRSEMTRAVFGAIADSGLNFGNCRTESEIQIAIKRHFDRVAAIVRQDQARRAGIR